jgi:membrane fusion protein (multidrug efflux system)|tara:strand:- start:10584 stop:11702 length:1119 start_codon:yes stop_codon:yes gene_type:complete
MKRNQIIILGTLFLIFAFIFIYIKSKKKEVEKPMKEAETIVYVPVRTALNQEKEMQIISYGQVSTNAEIDIAVEVQGKLEQGAVYLKPGVKFSKGQVLFRVNNEEAYYTLSARKIQLANLVVGAMPDVELDFPSEKTKWLQFLDNIQAGKRLPTLPEMNSSKEKMFMTSRGIIAEYYNIRSAESRMEKYVYIAPFSGTVLETYAEPGSIANPGTRLARIAKTNDFEIKVPISLDNLGNYQKQGSVTFSNSDGLMVGTGSISRISDVINQQTQSVDVYYSIRPVGNQKIYSGLFLNVAINQKAITESITVPRMAVTEGKVNLLKNGQIVPRVIQVVGNKPDSLYISGLENGEQVILEKVEVDTKGKTFKGINR